MNDRGALFLLLSLACVCAALLYLDFYRQGELELIGQRVDELERQRQKRAATPARRQPSEGKP